MATVRISGNWRNINRKEFAGVAAVDQDGRIDRTLEIPEEAYEAIERDIAKNALEGTILMGNGVRFDYFVDR